MPSNYYHAALYLILYNADQYSSASFVKLSNIHGIPKTDPRWWYFEPLWKITSTEMLSSYVNKLGRGHYNLTKNGRDIYTKMNSIWDISKALEIYLSVEPPHYTTIYNNITDIIKSPTFCL
jgi:hypothetical protein